MGFSIQTILKQHVCFHMLLMNKKSLQINQPIFCSLYQPQKNFNVPFHSFVNVLKLFLSFQNKLFKNTSCILLASTKIVFPATKTALSDNISMEQNFLTFYFVCLAMAQIFHEIQKPTKEGTRPDRCF